MKYATTRAATFTVGMIVLALNVACGLGDLFGTNGDAPVAAPAPLPPPSASSPVVVPAVQIGGVNTEHHPDLFNSTLTVDCTVLNSGATPVQATLQSEMQRQSGSLQQQRLVWVNPGHQVERFTFGADVGETNARGICSIVR